MLTKKEITRGGHNWKARSSSIGIMGKVERRHHVEGKRQPESPKAVSINHRADNSHTGTG